MVVIVRLPPEANLGGLLVIFWILVAHCHTRARLIQFVTQLHCTINITRRTLPLRLSISVNSLRIVARLSGN